jgi:HEPN domain-containing protein
MAIMPNRKDDWLRQADHELGVARTTFDAGQYDWSCFAAQQAAEKALKALYQHHHSEGWGHVLVRLIEGLQSDEPDLARFLDAAKTLDKCYIPTRYPNGLERGAPADAYTAAEAQQAIAHAGNIIQFCQTRCDD